MKSRALSIAAGGETLTAYWLQPADAFASLALAHGAGAGAAHPSMTAIAEGLALRGVATLRYNFPYKEKGGARPDPPAVAHHAVRAAIAETKRLAPRLLLFAGGRSFGGRMTSQAEALQATDGLAGLVFFAFPLHPAGNARVERAEHLAQVRAPMLFLQGDRDALADIGRLRQVVAALAGRAALTEIAGADHAFKRRGASGKDALPEALDAAAAWMRQFG
jgi:hypothetical protein